MRKGGDRPLVIGDTAKTKKMAGRETSDRPGKEEGESAEAQ